MNDDSHCSSETKSADDETWLDNTASSKPRPLDHNRHRPIFSTKLESGFSFQKNPNGSQPSDISGECRLLSTTLATPSLRRPRKSTTATKLSTALSNGSLDPRKGHLRNQNFGGGSEDPNTHNGSSRRIQKNKSTKIPDMALLKRLKGERERDTKRSLDMTQRVIRHAPRKLRRKINQQSRDLSVVEERKSADLSRTDYHGKDGKTTRTLSCFHSHRRLNVL
jgi:hypothetical protein